VGNRNVRKIVRVYVKNIRDCRRDRRCRGGRSNAALECTSMPSIGGGLDPSLDECVVIRVCGFLM
jgi:hypothetical protein